jgi:heme-degrading monooxygenase HmoA
VKKPWYAWKRLVISKMKESIPEYEAVKGLQNKFYSFTENQAYFGGIYFWESELHAREWFNQDWFDRTEKKYGIKGLVLHYQIVQIQRISEQIRNKGNYCAVISYSSDLKQELNSNIAGLYLKIDLLDSTSKPCTLLLWETKKQAKTFFKNRLINIEYFEVPLLLYSYLDKK